MTVADGSSRPRRGLLGFARDLWDVLRRPSSVFALGTLVLAGFLAGIIFWGAFNTALEITNTEKFCTSCHEMRDNVFAELKSTIHFSNRSGVRASCPDCHVPHDWTDKIARKMQASKEVWGHLFGTIDTREKFQEHRRSWRCTSGHG
jgi:cytochrome c-type protein NapC